MCLVIPIGTSAQIAVKDITVYKRCKPTEDQNVVKSLYMLYPYTLNKLYKTDIEHSSAPQNFDMYELNILKEIYGEDWASRTDRIQKGHHSCLTEERLTIDDSMNLSPDWKNYICTIPKGSVFYVGYTDLVVSNQIIINKQCHE